MTAAEELREAALLIRRQNGPGSVLHQFWYELADWLASVSYRYDDDDRSDPEPEDWNAALTLARAYAKCPVEAVLGPESIYPCRLPRGHAGTHDYMPEVPA